MSVHNPLLAYQQNTTKTASPGELTLMLYNGCLKFIKQAKLAIEQNNIEERNTNLIKAQNIIQELIVTLNMDMEISKHLFQMYEFILNKLIEANVDNDINTLKEAEEFVIQFRDTWKEAIQINRQQQFGTGVTKESV